jgi:chromosome segregation ATPase
MTSFNNVVNISLQYQNDTLKKQLQEKNAYIEILQKEYNELNSKKIELNMKYNELNSQYNELNKKNIESNKIESNKIESNSYLNYMYSFFK